MYISRPTRRTRCISAILSLLLLVSTLASSLGIAPSATAGISSNAHDANSNAVTDVTGATSVSESAIDPVTDIMSGTETALASTPTATSTADTLTPTEGTPTTLSTVNSTSTSTSTGTSTGIGTYTSTPTPNSSSTALTSTATSTNIPTIIITGTPPPTYTIGLPTPVPTLTPIPDTNYTDQAINQVRTALLAEVDALPAYTQTITGTGTLISGLDGGRVSLEDGSFTLGLRPGVVPLTDTVNVRIDPRTFSEGDPRATRNGYPLSYTFELTATHGVSGPPIVGFGKDAVLLWNPDPVTLVAAGVSGNLHVYTFNEQSHQWEEVPSQWDAATGQLVATTPHFSLYSVGSGFDKVNNYLPSVSNFEMDLQSGTSSVNYPIDVPSAPGGFAPKVSLRYNSGNIDRVDVTNQGTSSVGWGWSLSMSYIAATQHHFGGCDPIFEYNYHPWTASISVDGVNGDLTKGDDDTSGSNDYWHTSIESFARIKYNPGSGGSRTTDSWEAWTKDGTHYIFDKQALDEDKHNRPNGCSGGPNERTTYKWMLSKATDIHGNVINYSYWYQKTDDTYTSTPITGAITRAVYPKEITYGADSGVGQDKARVLFQITSRAIGSYNDISSNDTTDGIYQSFRINRIETARWQQSTSGFVLQRAYDLTQDFSTVLKDTSNNPYRHLTLTEIVPRANDTTNGGTRLPSTTFQYYQEGCCTGESFVQQDWGHIYKARNGYGGEVRYFYDAAGGLQGSAATGYRRVRSRWIMDGIDAGSPPTPTTVSNSHFSKYYYDYRGAAQNSRSISAALYIPNQQPYPYHSPESEFRGFAWVREQDPSGQVTDHYFAQDDGRKAKEWRTQVGKASIMSDPMTSPPGTNTNWTVTGSVTPTQEPTGNSAWRLSQNGVMSRASTVGDGSDVEVSFFIKNRDDQGRLHPFASNFKLTRVCTGCTDYIGVEFYSVWYQSVSYYATYARVTWNSGGNTGTHDLRNNLYPAAQALPYQLFDIEPDGWYVLRLHTSPDGRFAVELHSVNSTNYVMVKSSDPADGSGTMPLFPTGQAWRFTHTVTNDGSGGTPGNEHYWSVVDDYSETRSVYSQSDVVYEPQTTFAPALAYSSNVYVGQTNNCRGMEINFVPMVESSSTIYGTGTEAGQVKRTKTQYMYEDTYGNQTFVKEYGDLGTTSDDRSARTNYTNAINMTYGQYLVGKVSQTVSYSTIDGANGSALAQSQHFYDNQTSYGVIPTPTSLPSLSGRANLTKLKQVGYVQGTQTPPYPEQQFGYDQYGHQTWVRDANYTTQNDTTVATGYDSYYHTFPVSVTYPNGRVDYTQYNWQRATILTDTPLDAITAMTDTNGLVTELRYDRFGRPSKVWSLKGGTAYGSEQYPNDEYIFPDYNQSSVTPPFAITYKRRVGTTNGETTWQTRWYDGRGRTMQDVSPKDATNSIIADTMYNANGQVESASLPYSLANSNNDPRRVFTPDTSKPKIVKLYDGVGRPSEVRNPDYPGNSSSHIIYDYGLFQWVGMVDESGHQKWQRTDMLGRIDMVRELDTIADPDTDVYTQYVYNALNKLTQVKRDATSQQPTISTMAYDALGRKSSMTDPDMGNWEYGYDLAGNLTSQRDALYLSNPTVNTDHQIFFKYDNMNRIREKFYGSAHYNGGTGGTPDVKYYYDDELSDASTKHSWGRLRLAEVTLQGQGAEKANGHSYEYDPRGLLVKDVVTTTLSSRVYETLYGYDNGGRLTTTVYPDPNVTHEVAATHYNLQGPGLPYDLTSSISTNNPIPVWNATYNDRGQMLTLVQGTTNPNNQLTTAYTYDDSTTKRGWLTNTTVTAGNGGTTVLNLSLGYTLNGNISSVTQNATDTGNVKFNNTFLYDGLDRMTKATSSGTGGYTSIFLEEEYWFDEIGRMDSRKIGGTTYSVEYNDPAHKDGPTGYNGQQYGYDADGNQTVRNTTSNNQNQTRLFDPENRVSQIISNTVSSTGPTITDFIYDANGSRLIKSVSTATPTAGLKGEYYDNTDFTSLKMTRFDGPVDFNWGTSAPDASMGSDTFSVRWTGKVEASVAGTNKYYFYTESNDGVRLWVDGTLLIDQWNDHAQTEHTGSINLTGGEKYDIKLEYYDNTGSAIIQLKWLVPCGGADVCPVKELIPLNRLYAPAPVSADLGKQFCEAVAWTSKVNVASTTNTIEKTSGSEGWNGGASSTASIPLGSDGYAQSVAVSRSYHTIFGLSNGDQGQDYTDIDYAIHLQGEAGWPGDLVIFEAGSEKYRVYSSQGNPAYVAGDVLKVAVEGGVIKYYSNATLLYTSSTAPTTALVFDASVFHTGAKIKDAVLCRSRTHAVAQRTVYIGGLYEEELVGPNGTQYTTSTTPYTSYYTFGGKMVGMRRANQADANTNGQYRIVGDHLGSSTLIVNAAATPQVVSRQYHKPYGEVAWSGGGQAMTSLTTLGYTGQRLDPDSGLMFYNARMYDPVLSHFVSADTIAADKGDPKTRNRYSYVTNNPIKYTDPTGHEHSCMDAQTRSAANACDKAAEHLRKFGFKITYIDEWTVQELEWMLEAINDLLRAMDAGDYNYFAFRSVMNIKEGESIDLGNTERRPPQSHTGGMLLPGCDLMCGNTGKDTFQSTVAVNAKGLRDWLSANPNPAGPNVASDREAWKTAFKYAFVHELGHIMDQRCNNCYSTGLAFRIIGVKGYVPYKEHSMSKRGEENITEDWAETVATQVYPGVQPSNIHGSMYDAPRHRAYANSVFGMFSPTCKGHRC